MLLVLPSGIIADKYGGKYAIITACIFSVAYYYFLIEPTHEKVIIGEICNGVALAFYTGAFESWLFSLTSQKDALNLHTHLARSRELSYLAIVFGGSNWHVYKRSYFFIFINFNGRIFDRFFND